MARAAWPSDTAILEIRRFADAMKLEPSYPILTHGRYVSDGRAIVRTPVELGNWRAPTDADDWIWDLSDRMHPYITPKRGEKHLTDLGVVSVVFDLADRQERGPERGRCFAFPDGSGLVVPDDQIRELTPICGTPATWVARRPPSKYRPIVVAGMIGRETVLAITPYAHTLAGNRGLCSREQIDQLIAAQSTPA